MPSILNQTRRFSLNIENNAVWCRGSVTQRMVGSSYPPEPRAFLAFTLNAKFKLWALGDLSPGVLG